MILNFLVWYECDTLEYVLHTTNTDKAEVVPVLMHYTMKMYWGVEVKLHILLTLLLNGYV
jgi:hypothetical protein